MASTGSIRRRIITALPLFLCGTSATKLLMAADAEHELAALRAKWMNEWLKTKGPEGPLVLFRFADPMYAIVGPLSWKPSSASSITTTVDVPKGFVTDLASVPRAFWTLLRPDGKYTYAAIIHDFLYWDQGLVDRKTADEIFREAMLDFKVPKLEANAIYSAVRRAIFVGRQCRTETKWRKEDPSKVPLRPNGNLGILEEAG